jgi:PAS domain S-box-containing protein
MTEEPRFSPGSSRLVAVLGLAVAVSGILGLGVGWAGFSHLTSAFSEFQPIAPLTCWLLLLLGAAVLLSSRPGRIHHWERSFQALAWLALAGSLAVPVLRGLGWETFPGGSASPTAAVSVFTGWGLSLCAAASLAQGAEPGRAGFLRLQVGAALALVVTAGGILALLGDAVGLPLLQGTDNVPMPLPASALLTVLGIALLLRSGSDAWPASLFTIQDTNGVGFGSSRTLKLPLITFLILSLALLSGGSLFLRNQLTTNRRAVQENLQAVALLRVSQIKEWREEIQRDAEILHRSALAQRPLLQFLERGPGAPQEEEVRALLKAVEGRSFRRVDLYDAAGRLRCSTRGTPSDPPHEGHWDSFRAALASGEMAFDDLHPDGNTGQPRMHLWLPLRKVREAGGVAAGMVQFQIDPEQFLFPRIQSWPGNSPSAESLLVRREGNAVLFLNELRHRSGTALRLRVPIAENPQLPASRAVVGWTGFMNGKDYRGVPVVGWTQPVPGTQWYMVVKQDVSEIYGPIRRQVWTLATVLLGMVLGAALVIGHWVQRREAVLSASKLRAEQAGRIIAQRFRLLMDQARDIILLADPELRITDANTQACRAYGKAREDLFRLRLHDLAAAPEAEAQRNSLEEILERGEGRFESAHLDGEGTPFPVEVDARWVTLEGQSFLLAFIRDIRERKEQEQRILRLTQLYAALSQVNQAITREQTRESLLEKVCEALVEFGPFHLAWIAWAEPGDRVVSKAASYGDHLGYLDRISVRLDGSPESNGPVGTAILQGIPSIFNDFIGAPQTTPWREEALRCGLAAAAAFPVRSQDRICGAVVVYSSHKGLFGPEEEALMVETAGDVSFALNHIHEEQLRKTAEEALVASERFLREAQEAGQLGTYVWDIAEDRWRSSPILDRIFGIDDGFTRDLEGWLRLVDPEYRERLRAYVGEITAKRQPFDLEYPVRRASDQSRLWVYGRGQFDWDAEGHPLRLSGTIQDITARKENEERQRAMESHLQQAQKLESLGKLAGGVAHDMNNVLGAILSLATTHRPNLNPADPMAQALDTITSACMRGRGVVKGLLYFARRDLEDSSALDLNALVTETMNLLAYTTLKRVRLEKNLEDDLPMILGDGGAISHALMNLCVNAVDAMGDGGTIIVRTFRLSDGSFCLSVRDTGPGMSAELRAKAMEPFFTTKPAGEGTGLGLSMAFGTMKAHDGTLEILSEPGAGTEVRMVFPVSREAPPVAAPHPQDQKRSLPPSALRILLVDDDELIRESVGPMLEMMGHLVSTAPGGEKALQLIASGLEIDLVILDMNMPGMNGAETLDNILVMRPGQLVLLATGYSDQNLGALLDGRPMVTSIRKPFSMDELRRKLTEIPHPHG